MYRACTGYRVCTWINKVDAPSILMVLCHVDRVCSVQGVCGSRKACRLEARSAVRRAGAVADGGRRVQRVRVQHKGTARLDGPSRSGTCVTLTCPRRHCSRRPRGESACGPICGTSDGAAPAGRGGKRRQRQVALQQEWPSPLRHASDLRRLVKASLQRACGTASRSRARLRAERPGSASARPERRRAGRGPGGRAAARRVRRSAARSPTAAPPLPTLQVSPASPWSRRVRQWQPPASHASQAAAGERPLR